MTVPLSLLPALLLFGGALLYLVPLPRVSRARDFIPLMALALSAAALVILARTATGAIELFEPSAILPGLAISVQWNGAALSFGLFLLALMAARLMSSFGQDARAFVVGLLAVCGGALLFLAADNFTTVAAAWLVVELGLLCVPDPDTETRARVTTAFAWNLAAIVLWLSAGMMMANQGISLRLQEMVLTDLPALLVFLAVWIRSGLYPVHASAPGDVPGAAVRIGVPMLLGGYLMTRLLAASQGAMAFADEMAIVVVLALGGSALVTAGQLHGGTAFVWMLRAFGASLLLLPFLGDAREFVSVSVWLTLGATMLAVWSGIAWLWRGQLARVPLTMLVWVVVLFLAAALPLSPAFFGRVAILFGAYALGVAWWLLLVAGAALYLTPVWREIFASRDVAPKEPSRLEYAALGIGLLPAFVILIAPGIFMAPFGAQADAPAMFAQLLKPANLAALAFVAAGFIVPLLFCFELARRRSQGAGFLPPVLTGFLDLSAAGGMMDTVYRFLRGLTLQSLALLEQPPIAWLFFLAIWTAVWITGLAR
jgi:hypothetical protein